MLSSKELDRYCTTRPEGHCYELGIKKNNSLLSTEKLGVAVCSVAQCVYTNSGSQAMTRSHIREFTLGPLSEGRSAPGGCQLKGKAAN